ncbi:HNH endonuclease [Paenibacillus alkaliterrae]
MADVYLYPLADVKTKNTMNFSQNLTLYTTEGREGIHKKLRPDIQHEISLLIKSNIPNRSVEYTDNRVSRYSMKMGKCEITGMYLFAADVHCHHYNPLHLGGSDKFSNLRILHKEVHKLIHCTHKETIDVLISRLGITESLVSTINQYREICGLEPIDLS